MIEKEMIKLPEFQYSVVIRLILSDGWFSISNRGINRNLFLKQSLSHAKYVWFVFNILSHYCTSNPKLIVGIRFGVKTNALVIFTRALPSPPCPQKWGREA